MAISIVILVKLQEAVKKEVKNQLQQELLQKLDLDIDSDFYYEGFLVEMKSDDFEIVENIGMKYLYNVNINNSYTSWLKGGQKSLLMQCVNILQKNLKDCKIWYGGDGDLFPFEKIEQRTNRTPETTESDGCMFRSHP